MNGELTPFQFAYWVDRFLKDSEDLQLYGSYFKTWRTLPFKDINEVDRLRGEIGLPPLYKMFLRANLEFAKGYVAKGD